MNNNCIKLTFLKTIDNKIHDAGAKKISSALLTNLKLSKINLSGKKRICYCFQPANFYSDI